MRVAFADEMTKLVHQRDDIVLLSGDIGNRMFDGLKAKKPHQFYNCGIAEANMMSVGAAMGLNGLKPFIYTITPFTTTRCLEQIKIDVCYHESPVTIVGTGSGLSYAQLGPTHHSFEDISVMRSMPNMTVFCPADAMEVVMGINAAVDYQKPLYIRLGKKGEAVFHDKMLDDFSFGKSITMKSGDDVCILNVGNMMAVAMEAAAQLDDQGISTRVESFHTIKPLDSATLAEVFEKHDKVCVIEEHSIIGGLFSAVSEWVVLNMPYYAKKLKTICLPDNFIHHVSDQNQLRSMFGLTVKDVVSTLSAKQTQK